jgi:hypothetical protein
MLDARLEARSSGLAGHWRLQRFTVDPCGADAPAVLPNTAPAAAAADEPVEGVSGG